MPVPERIQHFDRLARWTNATSTDASLADSGRVTSNLVPSLIAPPRGFSAAALLIFKSRNVSWSYRGAPGGVGDPGILTAAAPPGVSGVGGSGG